MKTKKQGIVLLALFLAAMTMIPYVSAETILAETDKPATPDESNAQINKTLVKLPDFMPGINDKMTYQEEKRLKKNSIPSSPVPESEMAQIIIPKTWFIQNDKDPQSDKVQLTFPVKWLDSPIVNDNEEIVILRVPKKMLDLDDTNPDPEMITVSYPEMKFKEFTNRNAISLNAQVKKNSLKTDLQDSENLSPPTLRKSQIVSETLGIDKQTRGVIVRDTTYSVTAIKGYIEPMFYSNSGGESFRNYNEQEIYLDHQNDTIEFIGDFTDSGESYVWVAVFDTGGWATPWDWLKVDTTGTLQTVEFSLYLNNGVYNIYLYDSLTDTYYNNQYDDTDNPATKVNQIMASTELDTEGGISEYFKTKTYSRLDSTRVESEWKTPDITFDWYGYLSDEDYVKIGTTFQSSGRIKSTHYAGINY